MVLLVILFPAMVMHYKGAASTIDPNKVKIEIPQIDSAAARLRPAAGHQIAARVTHKQKDPGATAPGSFVSSGRSAASGGP